MARANYVILGILILYFSACTERMICPAYQSAYIYDKNELRKRFSYFQEDSTPKILTASKTKYLIAEETPYRKKLRSLQTIQMKKVMVLVPDSISGVKSDSVIAADLDRAARSVIDSTFIEDVPAKDSVASDEDSTYVITKDKEIRVLKYNMPDSLEYDSINNKYVAQRPKYYVDDIGYNTEQDNYMWYLRRSLVLPDVRLAKLQQSKGKEDKAGGAKEKQGFFGFFKNLFKKKQTEDIDSAEFEIQDGEEEFDFIDTTYQSAPDPKVRTSTRKNRLQKGEPADEEIVEAEEVPAKPSRKKKRRDDQEEDQEQPGDVPAKEEDEGDGF